MQRFAGKVVIVTGAGSGIGEATARRFSAEGATVALFGHTLSKIEAVAKTLPPERTTTRRVDVAKYREFAAAIAAVVKRFKRLDVLVNNAGVAFAGSVTGASLRHWDETMAVNAGGVFNGSRAAMPYLVKTKGSIVNTASVSGLGGDWGLATYNASKGAVINLTHAMALDAGRDGVRVNCVCPSLTFTPMTAGMTKSTKLMAKFAERIPMGRGAEPAEVAAVIAFLASEDAGFVTGVALPVDGGLSASNGQPRMG